MANIEEMKQEAADAKMREKAGKAYDKSLTTTEPAPVKKARGGPIAAAAPRALPTGFSRLANGQVQNRTGDVAANNRRAMGYSKGGATASKRADGIAERGKTRGTMVMCGGGMAKRK